MLWFLFIFYISMNCRKRSVFLAIYINKGYQVWIFVNLIYLLEYCLLSPISLFEIWDTLANFGKLIAPFLSFVLLIEYWDLSLREMYVEGSQSLSVESWLLILILILPWDPVFSFGLWSCVFLLILNRNENRCIPWINFKNTIFDSKWFLRRSDFFLANEQSASFIYHFCNIQESAP